MDKILEDIDIIKFWIENTNNVKELTKIYDQALVEKINILGGSQHLTSEDKHYLDNPFTQSDVDNYKFGWREMIKILKIEYNSYIDIFPVKFNASCSCLANIFVNICKCYLYLLITILDKDVCIIIINTMIKIQFNKIICINYDEMENIIKNIRCAFFNKTLYVDNHHKSCPFDEIRKI
jgi:hypothetical protein